MQDRDQLARELSEALDDNDKLRDQVQDLQDRLDVCVCVCVWGGEEGEERV